MAALPFMQIIPDSSGYAILDGNMVVNSGELEGGASRSRANVFGASGQCDVRWTCGPNAYNYIRAFYRTSITNGADTFQINLIWDTALLQLYTVKFVPGTFKLVSQNGLTYVLGGTLEVRPQPINATDDTGIITTIGTYGPNAMFFLDIFNHLVNVVFPATLKEVI